MEEDTLSLFRLNRAEDETGVSGVGVVAYGAVFPGGKCVVAWCAPGRPHSVAVYDSFEDAMLVHVASHKSKTSLEWCSTRSVEDLGRQRRPNNGLQPTPTQAIFGEAYS